MTHLLPDPNEATATPHAAATPAGSSHSGVVTSGSEVQIATRIAVGAPLLTAGTISIVRAPGIPDPQPPPTPIAKPSEAPAAPPDTRNKTKESAVPPAPKATPIEPQSPPKNRKAPRVAARGCLLPLLLLVLALLAVVGLANWTSNSSHKQSTPSATGALRSGTTSRSNPRASSTGVATTSTPPTTSRPRRSRGPIGLPPPFGSVPRTQPVAIELIIDPALHDAETEESSFNDELAATTDYIETYSLPTDKIGVPGSGALEPLQGKGGRFIAQANGVGTDPLTPDAAMADAVARLQPLADHRRAVIVIGSRSFLDQFAPPADSQITMRAVDIAPGTPASGDATTSHASLTVRGDLAKALARGFVETAGSGWRGPTG